MPFLSFVIPALFELQPRTPWLLWDQLQIRFRFCLLQNELAGLGMQSPQLKSVQLPGLVIELVQLLVLVGPTMSPM